MDGIPTKYDPLDLDAAALDLRITGMTCSVCAGRVEKVLSAVDGVARVTVNLATEKAHVESAEGTRLDPKILAKAVVDAGYGALFEAEPEKQSQILRAADRRELFLLVAAVIFTLPFIVQMMAMPSSLAFEFSPLVQLALASFVQFVPGYRFYRPAWRALQAGSANMDLLVVLGTSATWGLSTTLIWMDWPDIRPHSLYFEASASVITLVLVGKFLETKARRNTASAIKSLMALRPATARIRQHGVDRDIPLALLNKGDCLVTKPGERIAADAIVRDGVSHVDEALITGESAAVEKHTGDILIGGAINGEGLLLAEVTAIGQDSKLAQIIKLVETAQVNKAPIQKLVDRISGYFVPLIIVLAVLTMVGWLLVGASLEEALIHAATVLVIACPCALGLATPTAIMVGTGAAAKAGILIRDMDALQQARLINCVVFDKTGTLTQGAPEVIGTTATGVDETELIRLVAAAQQGSEHPLAKALIAHAQGLTLPGLKQFEAYPGRGIGATIDGRSLVIGSARLMGENTIDLSNLKDQAGQYTAAGHTLIWVGDRNRLEILGVIAVGDAVRSEASQAIKHLKAQGMEIVLLSGDNFDAVEKVAAQVGIERVFADVLPDEKANVIKKLKLQGFKVAMVGDGVNDAPALAFADLGVAMGSGTDVAMETAGVTLMRSDANLVVSAIDVSRATYRKIQQNLFWAFIYNVVAIPLAVTGVLSPVIAGAAMAMSSVSVVSNSLLLKGWREKGGHS